MLPSTLLRRWQRLRKFRERYLIPASFLGCVAKKKSGARSQFLPLSSSDSKERNLCGRWELIRAESGNQSKRATRGPLESRRARRGSQCMPAPRRGLSSRGLGLARGKGRERSQMKACEPFFCQTRQSWHFPNIRL